MFDRDEYIKEKPREKLNWKKIILIGLGVLAGLILTVSIGIWIYFLATFTTYHNEQDGVEISYPRSWTVTQHPFTDVIVAFVAPKDNALDTFAEDVNISTYDMSKQVYSTEDYAKVMVDQLLAIFGDLQLVDKRLFPIAGQQGYRMVLKITGEEAKTIVVYAFTIDKMGYHILYVGSNERHAKQQFLLDAMALSLRVAY